jgi:MFS family permease
LITLRAAINLVLLLVALPTLNRLLEKRGMSAPGKDLLISRFSLGFFTLGSLVISVAPAVTLAAIGIAIFALGSGFTPAARSLVTTFCHQDEAGLLYSALAIMQSIGGLVAGPLLTITFRWGLSLGNGWTGIPFAAVAGLFACGFLAASLVRL